MAATARRQCLVGINKPSRVSNGLRLLVRVINNGISGTFQAVFSNGIPTTVGNVFHGIASLIGKRSLGAEHRIRALMPLRDSLEIS